MTAPAPEVLPFLSAIASPTRPLGAALPAIDVPEAPSPWSPRPAAATVEAAAADDDAADAADDPGAEPAAPPAPPPIDVEALRAEAREAGRAEGLRETGELRARLAALVAALEAARAQLAGPAAELIAEAAAAVIAAWTQAADRRELFAPLVRAWLERGVAATPATARVHPDEVEAMRAAIAEAAAGPGAGLAQGLRVEPDAALRPGDVRLSAAALELGCAWDARLGELRAAIAAALTGERADAPAAAPTGDA